MHFFGKVGIKVKLKSFASNASDWDAFVPKTFNWLLIWVSLPLANYLSSKSLRINLNVSYLESAVLVIVIKSIHNSDTV